MFVIEPFMTQSVRYLCNLMCFMLFIPAMVWAQYPLLSNEYSVKKLTAEDGFVSSEIYSIIQDEQGVIWFGTAENGVMRFDGRKVHLFEFDSNKQNGLSHNDAGNLMIDRQGNVWIGTWGGGANLYDPRTGQFKNFWHDPQRPDSLSANRIQSLYHDEDGTIWLGSYDQGLNRYLGDNRFEHIKKSQDGKPGLSHNRIWGMVNRDRDNLFIATSFGLNLFNKKANTFSYYFPDPNNHTPTGANEIRHVLKTSKGAIYVGTQQGPYLFDDMKQTFTALGVVNGEHLGQVNSMIEDQDGYIWYVTSKGVFRQDHKTKEVEQLDLEHNSGLRIIFEDSAKTLWVTNEVKGIYKLVPHRKFKSINNLELVAPNGIIADRNGDLLVASSTSKLYRWRVASQQLEQLFDVVFSEADGFNANRLLERPVLFLEGENTLWLAQDEGLARLDLMTLQTRLITYPEDAPGFSQFREIRALSVDKFGQVWIGTYKNGVYVYDPAKQIFRHLGLQNGLSHPEVLEIYRDKADVMWVGTGDGVNIWQEDKQAFLSLKNSKHQSDSLLGSIVQDIHESQDGRLWIATQKGLNLFDPNSRTFTHFTTTDGLASSLIRAVVDDKTGALWLTTNKGVTQFNPNTNEVTNFDSQNGLLGLNYYPSSLVKAVNDTLFTSSQRGIEYFNTEPLKINQRDPNVILTGFHKMGQPFELDKPYSYVSDIYLSHRDYIFSFEFSVLDFISPNKNHFAYKLEGYDDNWIDIGNRNTASFTNLDGGTYRFLVKATNSHGKWGENILDITLHVAPPWWKTWWAYTGYLLITLLVVSVAIYFRTRLQKVEIARQKQFVHELELQVAEKTVSLTSQAEDLASALKKAEEATKLKSEFLANMSHEIRTPMNGVLGMLDLLKSSSLTSEQAHAAEIASSSANSLLTLINDILDFSKIEADKLELELIDFDLRQLISHLAQSMALTAQNKNVELILDLAEMEVDEVHSDPGRIRQVLTNILSNAIKFTEHGYIKLTVKLTKSDSPLQYDFVCQIEDSGIGIPSEKLSTLFDAFSQVDASTTRKYGGTGLGLSITKRLCQLLKGDVSVSSQLGSGSCFEIRLLLNDASKSSQVQTTSLVTNVHVLVADRCEHVCTVVRKELQKLSVRVSESNSLENAVACYQQYRDSDESIDLVLLDVKLVPPNLDSIAPMFKSKKQSHKTKLVFMTRLNDQFDANTLIEKGVDGHFAKPVTLSHLHYALGIIHGEAACALENAEVTTKSEKAEQVNDIDVSNAQVLLVEDNKVNQIVALRILNELGVVVTVAENGVEALQILNDARDERRFNVILMDCQMPLMDGYEATYKIRDGHAGHEYKTIPVIAMTANAMQGDKQKCLDAGMDDYISKPIDTSLLKEKLRSWISRS
ncbi:hypothetical protein PALB_13100 [Pseudoalteromonas luteoviolacea B = ATCC 29581]|nr:hypothetical protein PALB_13100 [Pseudoalteromonas luteoviolacea B = ATCC 29581]